MSTTTMEPLALLTDDEVTRGAPADDAAGFGTLATARGHLPLRALDVRARIDGLLAEVTVEQTFVNALGEPLEATYIFPLPDRAAVTRFRMEAAGRVTDGVLQERGAARREYDQAVRAGHRAAIAEEERPGVFTVRVGNVPAGEEARVTLTFSGPLAYDGGEATFRFPLVVAPRYIPGTPLPGPNVGAGTAADTDAVPDASRISPPVLLRDFPNPVRLSLAADVYPSDVPLGAFRSSLHAVVGDRDADGVRRIRLHPGERLDRDFVLRFRVGADAVRPSLVVHPDDGGGEGTFLLTVVPPAEAGTALRPRDVVFVLDRSGSMGGWKMVAARRALTRMVNALNDRDRFAVWAFDDRVETPPGFPADGLAPATSRNRFQAAEFLARVDARGGTEMAGPLDRAVQVLARGGEADGVLVLVTDGQVGNEDQLLARLGPRVGRTRVFTLGIDTAVNAAFLRRLAEMGGGLCELVESEERLDEVMDRFQRRIGTPVLTHLRVEPNGLAIVADTVVPGRLPDVYAGAPVLIQGRYRGAAGGALTLHATDGAGQLVSLPVPARARDNPAVAHVWARGHVRELEDRFATRAGDPAELERRIVAVALRFGVLCRFTAFVAVDRAETVNEGGAVHRVTQPVEAPAGWAEPAMLGAFGSVQAGALPAVACALPPPSASASPVPAARNALEAERRPAARGPAWKSSDEGSLGSKGPSKGSRARGSAGGRLKLLWAVLILAGFGLLAYLLVWLW